MNRTYTRTGKMVERRIRDEHILVPVGDNLYELDSLFALNEVASFIWSRTEGGARGSGIAKSVVERFEVQHDEAEADTERILSELIELGALEAQDTVD